MAKWSGKIGFATQSETAPGVWKDTVVERNYIGELRRVSRRMQAQQGSINDNLVMVNEISIVADPFANGNFQSIRYVTFLGSKWKVSTVDASIRPRMVLQLGEAYDG